MVAFGFIILILIIVDTRMSFLDLLVHLLYILMFLFAALWKKNRAITIGLFVYSIPFNLSLFKNYYTGWTEGGQIEDRFWLLGFIFSVASIILFVTGFSKNVNLITWTKEMKLKDYTIVLILLIVTAIIQITTRYFC